MNLTDPHESVQSAQKRRWLMPVGVAVGTCMMIGLAATLVFGSLNRGFQYAMGTCVVVEKSLVTEPMVAAGEVMQCEFVLSNLSFSDRTLIGADVSCPCVVAQKLPLTLPARSDTILEATMRPPRMAVGEPYEATIVGYLDVPHDPILLRLVTDKVGPPPVEEAAGETEKEAVKESDGAHVPSDKSESP